MHRESKFFEGANVIIGKNLVASVVKIICDHWDLKYLGLSPQFANFIRTIPLQRESASLHRCQSSRAQRAVLEVGRGTRLSGSLCDPMQIRDKHYITYEYRERLFVWSNAVIFTILLKVEAHPHQSPRRDQRALPDRAQSARPYDGGLRVPRECAAGEPQRHAFAPELSCVPPLLSELRLGPGQQPNHRDWLDIAYCNYLIREYLRAKLDLRLVVDGEHMCFLGLLVCRASNFVRALFSDRN